MFIAAQRLSFSNILIYLYVNLKILWYECAIASYKWRILLFLISRYA